MSLIRSLSNAEGLYIGHTKSDRTGKTVVFISYFPNEDHSLNAQMVECNPKDFRRLCNKYRKDFGGSHGDPPVRAGGLLLRATPADRLELVIRQSRKPSVRIPMWKVTWEYIVRNELETRSWYA